MDGGSSDTRSNAADQPWPGRSVMRGRARNGGPCLSCAQSLRRGSEGDFSAFGWASPRSSTCWWMGRLRDVGRDSRICRRRSARCSAPTVTTASRRRSTASSTTSVCWCSTVTARRRQDERTPDRRDRLERGRPLPSSRRPGYEARIVLGVRPCDRRPRHLHGGRHGPPDELGKRVSAQLKVRLRARWRPAFTAR